MRKRLTQEEFLRRAIKTHGDKYDYSKLNYVNSRTNVIITCSKHGDFEQNPRSHIRGCECPSCSKTHRGKGVSHKKRRALVYGVGINDYEGSVTSDAFETKIYRLWKALLQRCYKERNDACVSYKDCSVCEEWLYYSNFRKWVLENYKEDYQLDKDILIKGNKIYSPDTCLFVPSLINSLIIKQKSRRGDLPIGVSRKGDKYRAIIRKKCDYVQIGLYDEIEDAFIAYKNEKERYVKEVAQEYYSKGLITQRVYDALMNYEVEIDD